MLLPRWLVLQAILALAFLPVQRCLGQVLRPDTLRSYELAEIVIGEEAGEAAVPLTTMQHVSLADIVREDAASMADVARRIPAAHVQTNSRGETLVYLRGAGERQVALFFDGALLNVPWDNRIDMSLIPPSVVGGMRTAKGIPSVVYGTNVQGGAINLTSRALEQEGRFTEAFSLAGHPAHTQAYVTHLGRWERFSYTGSVGYVQRDGMPLPKEASLPFSQSGDDLRTNTDHRLLNLFGRVGYETDGIRLGVSALHLNGEKGVAPEGHLDPEASSVRFWRYPNWHSTILILNGEAPLGPGTRLRGAVWGSHFAQTIAQYRSAAYEARQEAEEDEDRTAGFRLTVHQTLSHGTARLALNGLTSRHAQRDLRYDAEGVLEGRRSDYPVLHYRQHVFSLGGEYETHLDARLRLLAGLSLDGIVTPETGDKPARDPQTALGLNTALAVDLAPAWTLRAAAGRKVRFPTMRELFSGALNRFLINPDLKPESSFISELGLATRHEQVSGEAIIFFTRTFDTIDQRNVTVHNGAGEPEQRRQRVNLEGSRVVGVELVGAVQPLAALKVHGHLTYMHPRAYEDGETRRLTEKPEWLGTLTLDYAGPLGLSAMVQAVYTGRAYGLRENNTLAMLPTSLVLDARLGYRLTVHRPRLISTELFVRVDNLTDELSLPQLGLPGPGRVVSLGIDVSL